MDAGDADEEFVELALDDGERVLVVAALCVREASTRASGRARGRGDDGWGSRMMDAGDADVEDVAVALDDDRVVAAFCLRVALRRRRAREASDAGTLRRFQHRKCP